MSQKLRVLELYCGLGGCAAALGERAEVVAAVDINQTALAVYAANFPHPTFTATLESLPTATWRAWQADLWWLSPPCQPYTQRGRQRDLDDPRAVSFLAVLEHLAELRPPWVALENVPGFCGSRAHARLREVLQAGGYTVREQLLCPTELGVPNRRRRFYLIANRCGVTQLEPRPEAGARFRVRDILDVQPAPTLTVAAEILARYAGALHLVDARRDEAECSCFTAGYGRSYIRSGSYLRDGAQVRRFSPREILRLLCFPDSYQLPAELADPPAWRLVGNSLSVRAVCTILQPFLEQLGNPLPAL